MNPRAALLNFQQGWKYSTKAHIVVDSGFSGEDVMMATDDNGFRVTASFNRNHKLWIFQTLQGAVRDTKCAALMEADGRIWSVHRTAEETHFITTTGFIANNQLLPLPSFAFTAEDLNVLKKMSKRALIRMATELKVPIGERNLINFLTVLQI
jgi:hypothetical protein